MGVIRDTSHIKQYIWTSVRFLTGSIMVDVLHSRVQVARMAAPPFPQNVSIAEIKQGRDSATSQMIQISALLALTPEQILNNCFGFALWIILPSFICSVLICCLFSNLQDFSVWDSLDNVRCLLLATCWLDPTSSSGLRLNYKARIVTNTFLIIFRQIDMVFSPCRDSCLRHLAVHCKSVFLINIVERSVCFLRKLGALVLSLDKQREIGPLFNVLLPTTQSPVCSREN
ncbi:uncharacterized protein LOC119771769 [Cyprinodon tularosa]|uniref:uncharacterized protein LOC119771769 n=1 Tax=Cyprinodon tularosa TaxID=77115 RepID=UPI0018E26270|nr:uncharacterized protein LOC119771769 [Cyprinodon tularosa]